MKKIIILTTALILTGAGLLGNNVSRESIFDQENRLQWQKSETQPMSWDEAKAFCEGSKQQKRLILNGHTDWRLPKIEEFQSAFQLKESFPRLISWYYWTSESFDSNTKEAWLMEFSYGTAVPDLKEHKYNVRCVRGL